MALFHLKTQVLSRSNGRNVFKALAYRRAIKLTDPSTGITYDFRYIKDVVHSEIVIPENSPQWIKDIVEIEKTDKVQAAHLLANSIELREKRKDAQLVREMNIALPLELNKEQCLALCREYASYFCEHGMVAEFNIHWKKGNPHFHLILSMRELTENGWGNKVRAWNNDTLHEQWREKWTEFHNQHLALAGYYNFITHLSYVDQGIDLKPTIHEGNEQNIANQQARIRNQEIRKRNLQKIIDNPEVVLERLSQQSATFSIEDIAKSLSTQLEPANQEIGFPTPMPPMAVKQNLASRVSGFLSAVAPKVFQQSTSSPQATVAQSPVAAVPEPTIDIFPNATPEQIVAKVLGEITKNESVFTEKYVSYILQRHIKNPDEVAQALIEIKNAPQLMAIGLGEDGRERYTTQDMFSLENDLQDLADALNSRANHKVKGRIINQCIKEFNLKDDQAKAIRHILKGNDITCVVGRAGTGKSYSLKAARSAWEKSGYTVHGVALAGIAADNLTNETGIRSNTVESFSYSISSQKLTLTPADIVIMDEAGMTDSLSMSKVMTAIDQSGAKLVLVGDHAQLQPVGPGAVFRALLERTGFAELVTVRRQKEAWQREATLHFASGNAKKALEYYEQHQCIHLSDTPTLACEALINDWHQSVQASALQDNLMLTYKNDDVDRLNLLARAKIIEQGGLSLAYSARTAKGTLDIAAGERIIFLENSWRYGIKNGQRGTIAQIELDAQNQASKIHVQVDNKEKPIVFDINNYNKFNYGYACTVHRSQGVTVKNAFVFISKRWNKILSYVAMTRHQESVHVYADKENYQSLDALKKGMAKGVLKDSVLDYPLAFAERRGIDTETPGNIARLQKHLKDKLQWMGESLKNNFEQTFFPGHYWEKKERAAAKKQRLEETLQRREDAKKIAAYVDANKCVGIAYEALEERKRELGIEQETDPKKIADALANNPFLKDFKIALKERDSLAYDIYQEHGKYTKALEIYDISLEKLQKETKRLQMSLNVERYIKECAQQRVIHRDKLASIIQNDIKTYYPLLFDNAVDLSVLRTHACAHDKRNILKGFSVTEREDFRRVEHYLKLTTNAGKLWQAIAEKEKSLKSHLLLAEDLTPYQLLRLQALAKTGAPLLREMLTNAAALTQERDAAAAAIYANLKRYEAGLSFYEVGEALNQNDKTMEWAKQKLERLTAQAARYNQKEQNNNLIREYLTTQEQSRQYEIAAQVIGNKKQYYSTIFKICQDPMATLRCLHRDTKAYQRLELIKGFSEEEHQAFLQVERYVEARKTVGKIWHENKETANHPIIKEISLTHQLLRDEFAYILHQEQDKYAQFLQSFEVDSEKLKKQSERHEVRQRVKHYLSTVQAGKTEEYEQAALIIQQGIKTHYFALKEQTISLVDLKVHAKAGLRRQLLTSLTSEQQQCFFAVERYVQLSQQTAKLWNEIKSQENNLQQTDLEFDAELTSYEIARLQAIDQIGTPILREQLIKAQALTQERNVVAYEINQNLENYKAGCEFYELGYYQSPADNPSEYDQKASVWAVQRLDRLKQQAHRFAEKENRKQVVQQYISLLNNQDAQRYSIAGQILAEKKHYFGVLFENVIEPLPIIRSLYQDTRSYNKEKFLDTLSPEEIEAFTKVQDYIQARRIVGQIRQESKDFETSHPQIKGTILPHLELRDTLAFEVFNHPEHYQKALEFFKIKTEHLGKNAFYHQIRSYCTDFKKQAGNFQARLELAKKITSNRSAYAVVKESTDLNWHQLQNYADYAIKQERIAALSPQEKQDYQMALKYKQLRREAGKLWHQILQDKETGKDVPQDLFEKAIAINAKRNELAFAIRESRIHFDEFLFSGQVQTKDISKHANAHEKQLKREQEYNNFARAHKAAGTETPRVRQAANVVSVQTQKPKAAKPYWDIEAINEALTARASLFVETLLGSPNRKLSNAATYRYGRKGSLSVTVTGAKAGLWYNFESGEKGNLLGLIQYQHNTDFKEAVKYAAEWSGIAPESNTVKQKLKPKIEQQVHLKATEFSEEQLKKIAYAKEIVANSFPIAGTLAEFYLREHRGIDKNIVNTNFMFNPAVKEPETQKCWPALVVVARNPQEEVQSVQCIYLDPKTTRKLKVEVPKRTYGPQEGASVLVQKPSSTLSPYDYAIAEGPETALSVAQSNKSLGVLVSLGVSNFSKICIPSHAKSVLLCADNDGINAASSKSLNTAIQALAERGLNVYVARPIDCKDFNDVLLRNGENEVKKIIDEARLVKKRLTTEELIANKENLLSNKVKIVVDFILKYQEYKDLASPKSLEAVEHKVDLFKEIGELSLVINDETLSKESIERHSYSHYFDVISSEYQKYVFIQKEVKAIAAEEIKSKDPLKDYITLRKKHEMSSQSMSEEERSFLKQKLEKLALVISNDAKLSYVANQQNLSKTIEVDAYSLQEKINSSFKITQGKVIKI